jgi:O-antigen/teichoic acid export membrane protein
VEGLARGRLAAVRERSLNFKAVLSGQIVRRLSWGVADQAVSSITNFAVSIYVARSLGAEQFGAFSLAYVTYPFVLNASRGLATDPLMVRFTAVDYRTWKRAVAQSSGLAAIVGLTSGLVVLGLAMLLSGYTRMSFLALGLSLPGLMLQDSWRFAFFARGRGGHAFLNDTIWAVTLIPLLFLVQRSGHANVFWFMLAWGMSATIGALVGPLQARVLPSLLGARDWLLRQRDLGIRFMAEGTAYSAAQQLRSYAIGGILGLAAVGYVQAANTLMGPVMILLLGMGLVTTPEAARIVHRSPRRLIPFCFLVSAGLAVGGLAWGVVLEIVLPRGAGQWLLGDIWRPTYPLALPQTLFVLGNCFLTGAQAGLHALGAAKRSLRAMLIQSGFYLALGILGAYLDGATGAVLGTALSSWIGAAVWWWQLRAAVRQHNAAGEGASPRGRQPGRHRKPRAAPTPAASSPFRLLDPGSSGTEEPGRTVYSLGDTRPAAEGAAAIRKQAAPDCTCFPHLARTALCSTRSAAPGPNCTYRQSRPRRTTWPR